MDKRIKYLLYMGLAILLLFGACACGAENSRQGRGIVRGNRIGYSRENNDNQTEQDETPQSDIEVPEAARCRILEIQEDYDVIRLEELSSGKTLQYAYTDATRIQSRNGSETTLSSLYSGLPVVIEVSEKTGKLTKIVPSDDQWIHTGITNFTIPEDAGYMTVGQTDYEFQDDIRVFSGNEQIALSQISAQDTLTLIGEGQSVLSIVVTNGHGMIELYNAEDFIGGWITVGKRVSHEIIENMVIEISEGTYTLAAASPDGYGDSTEISVSRDEVTKVDLNELKGEGPKYCELSFQVATAGAAVYLNGEAMDLSQVHKVKYGIYSLVVKAEGYEDWNKRLMVSSPQATIEIALTDSTQAAETASDTQTDTNTSKQESSGSNNGTSSGGKAGSLAGSLTGKQPGSTGSSSSGNNNSTESSSALSNVISALTGTGSTSGGLDSDTLSTISTLVDILKNNED